eukprot:COSAG02_NODE_54_length_43941_cov_54.857990_16_plen_58_part_00
MRSNSSLPAAVRSLNPYATVDRLGQLDLSVITNRLRISVSSVSNGYLAVAIQRIGSC